MSKRAVFLLVGGALCGAAIGALSTVLPRSSVRLADAHTLAPNHGGAIAARAAERIAAISFAAIAPQDGEALETPPPPPDVAIVFRRDLTAIEQTATGAVVWVVDWNQASGRRAIRVGEEFQEGWRVAAIGTQSVELRRRTERRQVDLYAPPPSDVEPQ